MVKLFQIKKTKQNKSMFYSTQEELLEVRKCINLTKLLINIHLEDVVQEGWHYGTSCNLCPAALFIVFEAAEEEDENQKNTHLLFQLWHR